MIGGSITIGIIIGIILIIWDPWYNTKLRRLVRYKKVKKLARDKSWLEIKRKQWAERDSDNEHFEKFSCSSTFKGYKLASLNREIYNKKSALIDRKYRQIERLLEGGEKWVSKD